jgi:hypothetical protein
VFSRLLWSKCKEASQQAARNTTCVNRERAITRTPPKLILRFGEPLCDFTATRYAPVHKFHLANRTSLEARALGVSLIARRTPFSQAKSGVLSANTTIKQKSTEWCFLALWSKWRHLIRTLFEKES